MLWMPILEFSLICGSGTSGSSSEHPTLANVPLSDPSPKVSFFHASYWHTVDRSSGCQCWGFRVLIPNSEKSWMYKSEHPSSLCILSSCCAPFKSFICNQLMEYPQKPIIVHWARWAINGFCEHVSRWTKWTVFVQEVPNLASKDWVNGPKRASPIRWKGNRHIWGVLKRRQLLILNYSPLIFTG